MTIPLQVSKFNDNWCVLYVIGVYIEQIFHPNCQHLSQFIFIYLYDYNVSYYLNFPCIVRFKWGATNDMQSIVIFAV